ncbi:hypothetical protein LTR73_001751 [Friedmanniomyces endolithicus]|nr:hypothetical protein LTR73_001751 [Friedmanniomyces endolithicus]
MGQKHQCPSGKASTAPHSNATSLSFGKSIAINTPPPQHQASSASNPSTSVDDDALHVFPVSVERQLATDLAVLAAWQPTPACVSAASIHLDPDLHGLVVTLSANEGVAGPVQTAFTEILTLLRTCATRCNVDNSDQIDTPLTIPALSRVSCASACPKVVVELHRNRILGRLGSPRFTRPKGCQRRTLVQVGTRITSLANDVPVLRRQPSQACRDDLAEFKTQLGRLAAAIDTIENAEGAPSIQDLIAVVHAAFEATIDGVSPTCFREPARDNQQGRNLASLARSYRQKFANARLDVIPHNPIIEIWPPASGRKHYVHAEIQMLVHHQLSPTSSLRPRCIGTSKSACFLCYCFLSAHGQYSVPESHGEVFEQWTVPDNASYTPGVRERLSDALRKTAMRTSKAVKASGKETRRHAPPMQSVLDLCLQRLRTPSASTLISRGADSDLLKKTAIDSASDGLELSVNGEAGSVHFLASTTTDRSTGRTTGAMVPALRPSGSIASNSRHSIASSVITGTTGLGSSSHTYHIDRGRCAHIQADGVEMFVELDEGVVDEDSASASCVVRKVHGATAWNHVACPFIEMATLIVGEPRTFDMTGSGRDQPSFVLIHDEHCSLAIA